MQESVGLAIDDMTDDSLLKPFLVSNRAKVELMCLTEYNEERHMKMERAEERAKIIENMRSHGFTEEQIKSVIDPDILS